LIKKSLRGFEIVGFSLAGEETVIAAPELNVCFDIGRAPREVISIDNVCISHGHMDHAAGVAYYLSQRGFIGNAGGRVIVHRALAQSFQKLMEVWADIEGHHSPGTIEGVAHLEDLPLRRDLLVRPFDVNHAAGALGYTVIELRHKLKPEHHGKSGPQLVALKKQGVVIEERIEVPVLTYTGDTALGRWLDLPFVRQSQALITECTFFDREHVSRARAGKHIHVVDLPAILEAVPEAEVLLCHATRRTDLRIAKRVLERTVRGEDAGRISLLMERPPRRRDDSPSPSEARSEA
jgi:ribonuclease Z